MTIRLKNIAAIAAVITVTFTVMVLSAAILSGETLISLACVAVIAASCAVIERLAI